MMLINERFEVCMYLIQTKESPQYKKITVLKLGENSQVHNETHCRFAG